MELGTSTLYWNKNLFQKTTIKMGKQKKSCTKVESNLVFLYVGILRFEHFGHNVVHLFQVLYTQGGII